MPHLENVRLRATLAEKMRAHRMSIDRLHEAVNALGDRPWSRAYIGHLRRYDDWTVNPDLARRLAVALGEDWDDLFYHQEAA